MGNNIPTDEHNLIVQTILKVNPDIHPHQLTVISDVPIAHGLGSSTTAVVAGIKIANQLGDLGLSIEDQVNLGTQIEGHPESVAAALLGNLVVSTFDGEKVTAATLPVPDISALMYIRPDGVSEAESRKKNCPSRSIMIQRFTLAARKMFLSLWLPKESGSRRYH